MHDTNALDKIRKLLAKAEDPACTPAEAEAFTAKAADLIAKYGIDAALVAASAPTAEVVGDRVIVVDAPYAQEKLTLLGWTAQALRCQSITRTRYRDGRKVLSVHLFGFAADLDRTELLYTSLLMQAAHALAVTDVPSWENPGAFRRSWYHGYAAAVYWRLTAAERRAAQTAAQSRTVEAGPSVALVLADRSALVTQALADAYPTLGTARPRRLTGSGQRDGYTAGQRANLGGTSLTQSRPATAIGA